MSGYHFDAIEYVSPNEVADRKLTSAQWDLYAQWAIESLEDMEWTK